MSARALCRQAAGLRLLASVPRRAVWRSKCQRLDSGCGKEEEERPDPAPWLEGYAAQYNPAAYRAAWRPAAASCGAEEELSPPFGQPRNPSEVRSSHGLSISQDALQDLASSQAESSDNEASPTPTPTEEAPGFFKPRAFQKCRPEYAAVSQDSAHRPAPISADEASALLDTVSAAGGSLEPRDVLGFLGELGRLPPRQLPLVWRHSYFTTLLRVTVERLRLFSDAQLLEVLRALLFLGVPPKHGMLGPLEAELARRTERMEPRQLLMAADLWRCFRRPAPKFLERLFDSATGWHWSDMGPAELVQLVYVMGEGRHAPANLLPVLESQLLRFLDQLTPEEIAVISLGLFKAQASLSLEAVQRLMDWAQTLLPEMSDYGLVNVLKLLRFSYLDHLGLLGALATEIPRRAPRMGMQGMMHVALACSALHYRDDVVLNAMADHLPTLTHQCRFKDAAKLLWAFGTVGFSPSQAPRLYPSLTEAMRSLEGDFYSFPEHLLTGLLGLVFVGLFPRDLLMTALSPKFVEVASSSRRLELKKDLVTLDASVGLEVPGWTGPRVDQALVEEVSAQLWSFVQPEVCMKPEVLEAERLLQELLGGAAFVRKCMILPHTRSIDLEVHLNSAGRPVPLCSEADLQGPGTEGGSPAVHALERGHQAVTLTEDLLAQLTNIKGATPNAPGKRPISPARSRSPMAAQDGAVPSGVDPSRGLLGVPPPLPTAGVQRLAVQVSHRNHFCYRSCQLLGLYALKRRHLSLVGYKVVELHHWEWFPLLKRSSSERLAYLRFKIFKDQC